ncbi:MAG: IS3 family transposase [Nitrososphaeraceae archaeon]
MRKATFQELLMMMKKNNVLKVSVLSGCSRSSYYYRPKQQQQQQPAAAVISGRNRRSSDLAAVLEAIEELALEYPSYGVRRITAMLRRSGIITSRKKVYRLMKLANLVRKRNVRKHVIMKRILTVPERQDQLWQQDITYIWCGRDGWCYLFSILDCYTREWLAYTFSTYCGTDEAIRTLEMAVLERFPDGAILPLLGLTTRSDGGSQYTSDRFISTLKVYGIRHEVTGKNRPDHNAYIEAFHKSIKEDCIWQHDFQTYQEADLVISKFFHDYNWNRPHSSLKYMTPKEFYAMINGGSN